MSGYNNLNLDIEVIRALSEDTRVEILQVIGNQELNASEIASKFLSHSRPTISHHLQIMKRAGILISQRYGKEIYYSVNMQTLSRLAQKLLEFTSFGSF